MFDDNEDYNELEFEQKLVEFEEKVSKKETKYYDLDFFEEVADYYLDRNEYAKALQAIEIALSFHPYATSLMLQQAETYVCIGKLNKGLEILNAIQEVESFNPELYILKADIYSQQRKFEEAIKNLQKAIKYANEDEVDDLYIDLAIEYENCEKYDKALEALKYALLKNPENEAALYEMAYCFDISEKNEEAIEFYLGFIDENPYSYLAWHHLGTCYTKVALFEKALEAFDYCLAINEEYATAYFNKASVLMALENYTEAIDNLQEVVKREEAITYTFLYLGQCYENLNELVLAEQYYLKALENDEDFYEAHLYLGMLKLRLEYLIEAEYHLLKSTRLDEENADAWYLLAELYEKKGDVQSAELAYLKALNLNSDTIELWLDYSHFKFEYQQTKEALDVLDLIINKIDKEKNAVAYALLVARKGVYHYLLGNKKEAMVLWENAVIVYPSIKENILDYMPSLINDVDFLNVVNK